MAKVENIVKHPIELIVEEPLPGSFVWRLLETDVQGKTSKVFRSAFDAADHYELALSAGQRALKSEIRRRSQDAGHGPASEKAGH